MPEAGHGSAVIWVCTAPPRAKALIVNLSNEELSRLFAGRELAPVYQQNDRSLFAMKVHLIEMKARDFAVNDEEMVSGIRPSLPQWLTH